MAQNGLFYTFYVPKILILFYECDCMQITLDGLVSCRFEIEVVFVFECEN